LGELPLPEEGGASGALASNEEAINDGSGAPTCGPDDANFNVLEKATEKVPAIDTDAIGTKKPRTVLAQLDDWWLTVDGEVVRAWWAPRAVPPQPGSLPNDFRSRPLSWCIPLPSRVLGVPRFWAWVPPGRTFRYETTDRADPEQADFIVYYAGVVRLHQVSPGIVDAQSERCRSCGAVLR
jgi:hypothetical protein